MPLTKVHCSAFNDYISFAKFEGGSFFLNYKRQVHVPSSFKTGKK